jgi:DNA-binding MarR family transcriptional regulator
LDKKQRAARRDKKQRAWDVYLELTEAAGWIERKLRAPLDAFGLTREEFRLLVTLYRGGPLTLTDAMERLGRSRQNLYVTVRRAEEFGWVDCAEARSAAAERRESQWPKERRGKPRFGARVTVLSLTQPGEKLIGDVLPKQEAIVKALVHGLDSREMDTMVRVCRKLRQADALPFWAEVLRQHREFERDAEAEESEKE